MLLVGQKYKFETWSVGSLQTIEMAKVIQREPFAHAARRLARHTTKQGSQTLVLISQFAAVILLIAFLNQGCERPSSGFKCHLTADVAECIRWIYALSWHINGWTNTTYFWDDNTLSCGQQHEYDTWLFTCYITSRLPPTGPQELTYVGVCGHIVWCNAKGVGDREILVTHSNSASKNTSETDIFPHGPKSLLTSVISL